MELPDEVIVGIFDACHSAVIDAMDDGVCVELGEGDARLRRIHQAYEWIQEYVSARATADGCELPGEYFDRLAERLEA